MNSWLWSLPVHAPVKLFFALRPDEAASAVIEKLSGGLKQAHRLKGRPIDRARLHNTLAAVHGLGTIAENIARAKAIGDRLRYPGFLMRYNWTGSFRGGSSGHPLVLRGEEESLAPLVDFRDALCVQMLQNGFVVEKSFTPHITMMWADRCIEEDCPVAPIAWMARDFVLIASLHGQSRHIEVASWPLR